MNNYKPRIADNILKRKLAGKGAVLIQGPKWCGKTTTAEQQAKSILYMDDPDIMRQNLELASISPKKLLVGETPRLVDEWQIAPQLWDAIRFEVDHREGTGHFILTGSAVPADNSKIHHSGTGRFSWLSMRTMSLFESGESNGEVSLNDLFAGQPDIFSTNNLNIDDVAWLICRGGWPKATDINADIALDQAYDYLEGVINSDISRVDGVVRDTERARRIMRSLARNQAGQVPISTICADIETNEKIADIRETISSYITALKKIFVIEDAPAWNPNLRSKSAIRTTDTRYFSDPSIGIAALGLGPSDLINDLHTMGLFFETMCVRDLRIYADSLGGTVYHFRDKNGLECDAVVHLKNGSYGLVEIKLGGDDHVREGVATLKSLESKIDTTRMKKPSFLMVLTAVGPYAYRREDGVYVVPVGCLKD
ncbi:MAG: ATP-binding protein [Bacteroidetes bacterium]|uniref:ATP-binding protein n=1 Tax=Candidatus Cryptobacteroides merdigallinarum TaxID=2840770 RepID=A0A9D9EIL6_9BACT|nr:ATP-binding protein [Candidatus Cryptobacteroides merdigallinarum]